MKKRAIKKHEDNDIQMKQESLKNLTGKFGDDKNDKLGFSEELSDGGVRNEMAEAQLKRISTETGEV